MDFDKKGRQLHQMLIICNKQIPQRKESITIFLTIPIIQPKTLNMLDPINDLLPPASSPTISSISSSDLDTESTGSFFHDRSTTLGTLMGVNFPAITFRAPSQHHRDAHASPALPRPKPNNKRRGPAAAAAERRRRRRWWRLCRDGGDGKPASLGEYLEVERRFGDGAFYGAAAELEGVMVRQQEGSNGRVLFADGRVLPPAGVDGEGGSPTGSALCRFPVSLSLSGMCGGGVGLN